MALRKLVKALEDIPEALREHYEKADDGYRLKTEEDGGDELARLRTALEKERSGRAVDVRALAELRKSIEGLDPEKAREALKLVQQFEEKKLLEEGKVEELFKSRTESMRADWTARETAFQKELKEAREKIMGHERQLSELIVDGTLKAAATAARVKPELLSALVLSAKAGTIDGIKWDLRDGKPVPLVGDTVKYGKDPSTPMTPEEYLEVVRQKAPPFFDSSSGGSATGSTGRPQGGEFTLTVSEATDMARYRAVRAAAEKAGKPVQIVNG